MLSILATFLLFAASRRWGSPDHLPEYLPSRLHAIWHFEVHIPRKKRPVQNTWFGSADSHGTSAPERHTASCLEKAISSCAPAMFARCGRFDLLAVDELPPKLPDAVRLARRDGVLQMMRATDDTRASTTTNHH
ncbi:hypothetical protein BZA05DRAFT_139211 [Tricharina praecox]|uniref:uncharacterized protein n=1 Tax=Tricharina praecox TaxID=43433 RepID=UPI002220BE92|nr:uncharacterized protein BZA05DRAFT_139211 [Tricharina praecox]KAI5846101.1 hypothetical protein BZA05DRAFT_139211 [Tricharina praecox]